MATQSVRDKMREDKKTQFNIWLPKETATHLKALRERTGKAYPLLLADALAALENTLSGEPAEPEPSPAPVADNELLQRLAALEASSSAWVPAHEQHEFQIDLLKHWQRDFEGRLSALESGLAASRLEPLPTPLVEPEPAKIADSAPSAPIENAIAELKRQGLGPQAATDELNRRGYRTGKGTLLQRGYVSSLLKRLG